MNLPGTNKQRNLSGGVNPQVNTARAVIGNLLASTGGTLEAARELADLTGHNAIANQIEELREHLLRLATKTDAVPDTQMDWDTLSVALQRPIDHAWLAKTKGNPAFLFYVRQRLKQALPELGSKEIGLLLCLLERIDEFVPRTSLQVTIQSRAASEQVIKVYMSRLRAGLSAIGVAEPIETGRGCYRMRSEAAIRLVEALRAVS